MHLMGSRVHYSFNQVDTYYYNESLPFTVIQVTSQIPSSTSQSVKQYTQSLEVGNKNTLLLFQQPHWYDV